MSEQATIDAAELARITTWLDGEREADLASGRALQEWAAARDIDLSALLVTAHGQAEAILAHVGRGALPGHMPITPGQAIGTAMILGFQLGIDAERRRRDNAELPS